MGFKPDQVLRSFKCVFALIGVVTLGVMLFKHFATGLADGITFQGASIQWNTISVSGVNVTIQVKFQNDNSISIPITDFAGNLIYGSYKIADLKLANSISLVANSITPLPITTRINFLDLSTEIVDLIISKQLKQDLRIEGLINIKGISSNVDYAIIG